MAKIIVMYEQPKDQEAFEKYYFDIHVPIAMKIPNLKNGAAHRVIQTQNTVAPLYLVAELDFEDVGVLHEAMESREMKETLEDVEHNLLEFLTKPPVVCIVE